MSEPNINILTNTCRNLLNRITEISNECADCLNALPNIKKQFRKVRNRAMEFENNTFVVLVVGPVKSGKSTLVNLIANEYVSPTHFLECTVRPSIISKLKDKDEASITSYTTENQENKVEYIDAIIDFIRGMEEEDALAGLNIDKVPLSIDNIRKKVELGLTESLNADTLVTVITTPGGQLLQKDVFIMDMPGFDGKYANLDDPVYETIAQRADLLIFVQSSNSAISKVSAEFLNILKENNKDVPVCLVHNFFEAAHWHNEKEKEDNNTTQKEFAIKEIKNLGFNIEEEHCFCINLGKVKDARAIEQNGEPKYADKMDILKPEADKYSIMEQKLYERIISHHDAIQLNNCISRTKQQLEKLRAIIANELRKRRDSIAEYEKIEGIFNGLNISGTFGITSRLPDDILQTTITNCIQTAVNTKLNGLSNNIRTNNTDAKNIVADLINYCETELINCLNRELDITGISRALHNVYLNRMQTILQTATTNRIEFNAQAIEEQSLAKVQAVSLSRNININTLVPDRLPPIFGLFWGHTYNDFSTYFREVKKILLGSNHPTITNSIIKDYILPLVETQINERIEDTEKTYKAHLEAVKESVKRRALDKIIPDDKEEYVNFTNSLTSLSDSIAKINIK